ncbi:unnamed protein product [Arctogadus glacialis]
MDAGFRFTWRPPLIPIFVHPFLHPVLSYGCPPPLLGWGHFSATSSKRSKEKCLSSADWKESETEMQREQDCDKKNEMERSLGKKHCANRYNMAFDWGPASGSQSLQVERDRDDIRPLRIELNVPPPHPRQSLNRLAV